MKLFLLVTGKAVGESYRVLVYGAWWALLLCIIFVFSMGACFIVFDLSKEYLFFLTICASRSSVGLKNSAYFLRNSFFFIPYYSFYVIVNVLLPGGNIVGGILVPLASALFLLFFLDAQCSIRSYLRVPYTMMRLFVMHMPVILIVGFCGAVLRYGMVSATYFLVEHFNILWIIPEALMVVMLVWSPVYSVLITNLYIRFFYENTKVYFVVP